MKPGTIVKLKDGQLATVVYHGLDGYGVKFGEIKLSQDEVDLIYSCGPMTKDDNDEKYKDITPEAMLREPWSGAELPCVGKDYEIVS